MNAPSSGMPRITPFITPSLAALTLIGAPLGGCASGPAEPTSGRVPTREWMEPDGRPFAPAAMSIFPLTQLQLDEEGEPWLLLFVELQDQWTDPVKATGWLTVFLEPAANRSGVVEHEARWDVDLTDPSVNSALFDPVTRTYRVQLGGLPRRARSMAQRSEERRSGGDQAGVQETMVFRAMFRTIGPNEEPVQLWSTFDLES